MTRLPTSLRLLCLCLATVASSAMSQTDPKPSPALTSPATSAVEDPFLWLEDVQGDKALAWVRERNAASEAALKARPEYAPIRAQVLEVLNAKDRIPGVMRRGNHLYNFWQDEQHRRGLWRRTTLAEYRKPEPAWEVLLDVDALGASEKENWVWGGATCLAPEYRRCLVSLSRGGADAKVVREFDSVSKSFVKDGFSLPEAKSDVDWIDENTLYVGADTGPGSMTDSGYPRTVRRWQRGTPLSESTLVFEGQPQDVAVSVMVDDTPGWQRTLFARSIDFFHRKMFLLQGDKLLPLDVPDDARLSFMRDTMLIQLRSDLEISGKRHPAGSLLATDAAAWIAGKRQVQVLFTPTPTRSLAGFTSTRDHLVLNLSDNVASALAVWRKEGPAFVSVPVEAPSPGTLNVAALHDPHVKDDPLANQYLLSYTDFLTPDSLFLADTTAGPVAARDRLKARAALFDAAGMRAEQRFATSKDGTRVPYFVIWPKEARTDGSTPTLLYGYGGFDVSLRPWYSGGMGRAWVSRGGALVIANIRGGGEFGPTWHQAAQKANKQRSYDDFIAVAEDLIARKLSSPRHLGIMGGSNGGLLVGATMVQRPDLFNAVVCQVPLLDMRRYNVLLAGASWMAEYGNPDKPEEWAWISGYSPYQNVKPGVKYPKVLFTTSTRDDRVHPGHARKMAARMLSQGHELLYYENIEGGHGGAADNAQRAHLQALEFSYLWQQLGR
jgi:prolyl oligopeptidase